MVKELNFKYNACNKFIREVKSVPDSLPSIIEMHKKIWKGGVQHKNLGPDGYGMFRTDDILSMTPDQVFLGNINDLLTASAHVWEARKDNYLNDLRRNGKPEILPTFYIDVCNQYKNHLVKNLKMMRSQIFDNGIGREKLCDNIVTALNMVDEYNQRSVCRYRKVEILNTSIADDRIIRCRISFNDRSDVESSFLNCSGRFLLPEGFEKGVKLTPINAISSLMRYFDVIETLNDEGAVKLFSLEPFMGKNFRRGSIDHELSRREAKENIKNVRSAEKFGFKFGI